MLTAIPKLINSHGLKLRAPDSTIIIFFFSQSINAYHLVLQSQPVPDITDSLLYQTIFSFYIVLKNGPGGADTRKTAGISLRSPYFLINNKEKINRRA